MNQSPESFEPKQEFEKIQDSPNEQSKSELDEFVRNRALQQEQIADLTVEAGHLFLDNPDMSENDLIEDVEALAIKQNITGEPFEVIKNLVKEFAKEHNVISQLREKYPDDLELATYLLGFEPEGGFEIEQDALSFIITLRVARDYRKIAGKGSGGCAAYQAKEGITVIIYNVFENAGETYKHEETHAINRAALKVLGHNFHRRADYFSRDFWPISSFNAQTELKSLETKVQKREYLKTVFWEIVLLDDRRIADEFLSYLRDGSNWSVGALIKTKDEGGLYDFGGDALDFYLGYLKDNLSADDSILVDEVSHSILREEYPKFIKNIGEHVDKLIQIGFSPDKIIALLLRHHIVRWPREIDRIVASKQYSNESEK